MHRCTVSAMPKSEANASPKSEAKAMAKSGEEGAGLVCGESGASKRGATFANEAALVAIWSPWASRPIWMPKLPSLMKDRIATFTQMRQMWRDLHAAAPRLTFKPSALKVALKLLMEQQIVLL